MEQNKLNRINELYKKQKSQGLTKEEKKEQTTLREEYIKLVRGNLRGTLNNIVVEDEEGNRKPLRKKDSE
jgi:uncharacterized protein YnzC (UPF0291/DUF896 family)